MEYWNKIEDLQCIELNVLSVYDDMKNNIKKTYKYLIYLISYIYIYTNFLEDDAECESFTTIY